MIKLKGLKFNVFLYRLHHVVSDINFLPTKSCFEALTDNKMTGKKRPRNSHSRK